MNIAVLGLGFMGSTHLKAIQNIKGAKLAAVVSSDEKKLAGDLTSIQGNLGGPGERMDFSKIARYKSIGEALKDPKVEAVDICLPTDQHAPVAFDALRAGKHVLVEKPMALDGATAEKMVEEAARAKRVLMTAQVLRFFPEYEAAARMVRSGELGETRSALLRRRCAAPGWSKWLGDASRSGGGVFDLLIHDVDYCMQVFGAPAAVSAFGHEDMPHGIDTICGALHYDHKATVVITGGWHHPKAYPFSMEFTIVCDGGTLEYSSAGRPLKLYDAAGGERAVDVPQQDGFQAEIEYFVECASKGARPEKCPPEESAAAVRVTRAMVESRSRNGEPIECSH
ncbi:MAG: Gfo/Idh/MocA family protein [Bryobacteraceae bacterium]